MLELVSPSIIHPSIHPPILIVAPLYAKALGIVGCRDEYSMPHFSSSRGKPDCQQPIVVSVRSSQKRGDVGSSWRNCGRPPELSIRGPVLAYPEEG